MRNKMVLMIAFSILSPNAFAANVRCDHCDLRGFRITAKSLGVGDHVVFSLSQGSASGFTVEREALDRRGSVQYQTFAYPRALTVDESAQFSAAMDIYRETATTMKFEEVVPIGNIPIQPPLDFSRMTSHEFARRMGDWHRVAQGVVQWARSPQGTLGSSAQWWQSAGSIVGVAGTQVEITVLFADGGKVTFKVDYGDETMGEQKGPIRDADNNVVPTPTDVQAVLTGTVVFSNATAQNAMNEHLAQMGWNSRFPQPPSTCRYSGPMIYECAWRQGLITFECRRLRAYP